jgi:bifunctional UDP-N-acetylglucosamine pyrophosphorylase/glucosamine-1-phosphate N-acetyltransferase
MRETLGAAGGTYVLQKEQRGTAHAVLQAQRQIPRTPGSTLLILNGDLPTIRSSTLRKFVARHRRTGAALSLLTTELQDPSGYGRILRDGNRVTRIVEHKDATRDEARVQEVNCGIYCADATKLFKALRRLRPDNAQGEYYLTDAVRDLIADGERVDATLHSDAQELLGVNTREELASTSRTLYSRKATELQQRGVTIVDADSTWIDPQARVGQDTTIYPNVTIEGPTVIGSDCVVRQGCRLTNVQVGREVEIKDFSVLIDSHVGNSVQIGPFAHLRPGAILEANSRVGNFVELKKSRLGRGSKASHLTYLGDAQIGPGCNIGAGTITCNYDGTHKHITRLGKNVFVGSNTQLVAPVTVGNEAYIGAGSTVTRNVPAGALAIARSRQLNIEHWVKEHRDTAKGKSSRKTPKSRKTKRK